MLYNLGILSLDILNQTEDTISLHTSVLQVNEPLIA